jgi:hypothetical protein
VAIRLPRAAGERVQAEKAAAHEALRTGATSVKKVAAEAALNAVALAKASE